MQQYMQRCTDVRSISDFSSVKFCFFETVPDTYPRVQKLIRLSHHSGITVTHNLALFVYLFVSVSAKEPTPYLR